MNSSTASEDNHVNIIIHVFVIGFHHKKGCVVEFSFPPLSQNDHLSGSDLPDPWKHLPTLALPDGAHNYEEDTIYFHLPSLEDAQQTIYGVSCYRQMNAENLLRRSSDITRETVQKSVCVLSRLPLFGMIQAKLELITHAYFDERDFSKVSLLEETYKNLNSSLPKDLLDGQQAFLGLSVRDFVLRFKHKTVLLFKLLLLEKKVLFYKAPVKNLCTTVLTLCSLIPGLIEKGLGEAATSVPNCIDVVTNESEIDKPGVIFNDNNNKICAEKHSTDSQNSKNLSEEYTLPCIENFKGENNNCISASEHNVDTLNVLSANEALNVKKKLRQQVFNKRCSQSSSSDTEGESWVKVNQLTPDIGSSDNSLTSSSDAETKIDCDLLSKDEKLLQEIDQMLDSDDKDKNLNNSSLKFQDDSSENFNFKDLQLKPADDDNVDSSCSAQSSSLQKSKSSVLSHSASVIANTANNVELRRWSSSQADERRTQFITTNTKQNLLFDCDDCGLPLSIFSNGMLCHPYLSLPFMDILNGINVRGFLVGATNVLFKQKKKLFDVVVEIEDGKVEVIDTDLRRQLNLTTEDLRFADHLVRHVMEDKQDVFLDGTGWEGGDEWLRAQFKIYVLSALRTSLLEGNCKENEAFNAYFMNSWKSTYNYKIWSSGKHMGVLEVNPGHPFHGQLSIADMKLKFSHTMQSTEKGRRLNNAVTSTGKAVLQTGKVVGGAITNAKSVVSSWWSNFSAAQQQEKLTELQSNEIISEKTVLPDEVEIERVT